MSGDHEQRPAVYRFVAPDGRSYVGSVRCSDGRGDKLARSNTRIADALKTHPAEAWRFEILQRLYPDCSELELRTAEQNHIVRLKTYLPEFGFNMRAAVLELATPEQLAQTSLEWRELRRTADARGKEASRTPYGATQSRGARSVGPMVEQFLAEDKRQRAERRHERRQARKRQAWVDARFAQRDARRQRKRRPLSKPAPAVPS